MKAITSSLAGFGVRITLTSHVNGVTKTVTGIHNKHHLSIDGDGNQVHSKNATIAIHEEVLNDVDYPVRDKNKEVAMIKDEVTVKDSTGVDKNYRIKSQMPDESFGLLVFVLEDFEA